MALSGSITTSSYSGRSVTLNWSATQNVANNTSTIAWSLAGSGSSNGWVVVSELRVTIDGAQVYYRGSDTHTNCYQGTQLANGITVISHANDGSKSITIKVEAGIYNWAINCSGSNTFTLNTIARASSITNVANVALGNVCSVQWIPASVSFTYRLKFALGDWNYTTGIISPAKTTVYTYTGYLIPLDVAYQIKNATTGTMTVYLYTYNGNTQIGSTASKTFTVTVPSNVKPTISSVTATIDNSENSIVQSWGVAVAGFTKVKLTASANGAYGSTISSFTVLGGYNTTQNGSALSYISIPITSSGTKNFVVSAKDSRGRISDAKSATAIFFYEYAKPTVSLFTVSRCAENQKQVTVKANWSFSSVNNKNTSSGMLYYKQSNQMNWTQYGIIDKNTDITLTTEFDETSSYNFRLVVTDALESSVQEEAFVSTMDVLMDFRSGGKGLAIGKVSESDNFEVKMNTIFMGDVFISWECGHIVRVLYPKCNKWKIERTIHNEK